MLVLQHPLQSQIQPASFLVGCNNGIRFRPERYSCNVAKMPSLLPHAALSHSAILPSIPAEYVYSHHLAALHQMKAYNV